MLHENLERSEPRVAPSAGPEVAALVLAAGSSSRFGPENKLLALRGSRSLLSQVLDQLGQSDVSKTLVVTGHDAVAVAAVCDAASHEAGNQLWQVHNARYASGMASSLICGIAELAEQGMDAVLVCLADMPEVTTQTMNALVAAFVQTPDKALYIPTFNGQRGNPVLIAASLFDSVLMLEGDVGARVLARQFPDTVLEVPCDSAEVLLDVDVLEDL